jgi:hypothetical protein
LLDHFPIVGDTDTEPESQVFETALAPTIAAIDNIDLDLWIASSDESTSAKATKELEELASLDVDDRSDTASVLKIEQDATSISWLRQPGTEAQLAFNFCLS